VPVLATNETNALGIGPKSSTSPGRSLRISVSATACTHVSVWDPAHLDGNAVLSALVAKVERLEVAYEFESSITSSVHLPVFRFE
jgi:hypothetical protein